MVGALRLAHVLRAEHLRSRDGPVLVDLVLDFHADFVVTTPVSGRAELGLIGELVADATAEDDGLALDALEVLVPAEDGLEGVANVVGELLVAASHEELAGDIGTGPVEGVLVGGGPVDKLRPDFLEGLGVGLHGNTNVDLVGNLQVDLRLKSDGALLVVLSRDLRRFI